MLIEEMTIDQLIALNEHICQRIDELRAQEDFDVLKQLRLGQEVHFNSRAGQVFGRVIKVNRKTVIVQTEDNRQWKVSAGMLRLMRNVG